MRKMRLADEHQRNELLHRIEDSANWRLGEEAGASIGAFLRLYWARVPLEDIEGRPADALFGAAFAHWRLAERRPTATPLVRAYNPSLDEHGWRSEHAVIEVVTDDMPFLVDSLIVELNRRDLAVHLVVHPILRVRRDAEGGLLGMAMADEPEDSVLTESFMHVEVTPQPAAELIKIEEDVRKVLSDVRAAYTDWFPTRERLDDVIASLGSSRNEEDVKETQAFLHWLRENNFTFLGYRAYEFSQADTGRITHIVEGSGLGLLRDPEFSVFDDLRAEAPVPRALSRFLDRSEILSVAKADRYSTVHRGVLIDCILVQYGGKAEGPVGVHLFIGLFSAAAYNRSARNIPLLRQKLARVLASAGFAPRSHDGRALANIVETFPRDELFQVSDDHLLEVALGILHLQHRQRVALFIRRDEFDRFISCLVFVPRDRYSTQLRLAIQSILSRAFAGQVTSHFFQVGDAQLARLHVIIQTTPGKIPPFDVRDLEREIVDASRSWADRLFDALQSVHGEEEARRLHARYAPAFPLGYRERFSTEQAIGDIDAIERALVSGGLELALWRPFAASHMQFRFKIYQPDKPLVLSHVLPVLEHMGLRVVDEIPHSVRARIGAGTQRTVVIHDFGLETFDGRAIDISDVGKRFHEAFLAVWEGRVESDGLNALVLSSGLDVDQVRVLRAYVRYLRQVRIPFTQAYLERVLTANPEITGAIVRLFMALFNPDADGDPEERAAPIRAGIALALDAVPSAEDDRILRRILNLVEATLRTTWFQSDERGRPKPYLAVKVDSRNIDDLPLPRPMVEVFVYSPRVEGIHLRGGRVARGGIRWSDRREDFRTEILGLMKAQMVKNAVIVPVGAKGGFVVKQRLDPSNRESWQAEGIACYRTLMRGLLDLTDNRVGGEIIPPPRVVRRDGDDPYLVVAADKGTASFSDIANAVAAEYSFWLGDAFASGGSRGYDHKTMGITARGAWESVKRHFRELGRDIQREDFTVIGVGDMSGDVFGNGMLLSPHTRLLAAFDHRHIFIDPDPDPSLSFAERQRLFALPRSSWTDYDPAKLSPGAAVFERSAKFLTMTPEIQARFGIQASRLRPAELITLLLRADVDLLWFGGIGTFVKAEDEPHADVGDRANDAVRVDGHTLRCRVIGEGANLGVTQLGRIEYARAGGRINTDFIDNSAGVDCSDHEVNIKILLDALVAEGDLTSKQRDRLLVEMTDEVAELVLRDNYLQTLAISIMEAEGLAGLEPSARLIRHLERQGYLNRAVDFLPDEDALAERAAQRQGLTRPEIAVIFSSAKIALNEDILASDLPDDPYLADDVVRYFPSPLRDRFRANIARHRLRRELIATTITNSLINRMGASFAGDLGEKTGMPAADTARAYIVARDVFAVRGLWDGIEALDGVIPAATQITLHREVQRLIERATLWFLRNGGSPLNVKDVIERFSQPIAALSAGIESLLPAAQCERILARAADWQNHGVPEDLARRLARLIVLPSACDIVRAGEVRGVDSGVVGPLYFAIGEELGFSWLRQRAEALNTVGYWQRLAVSAVIEELYANQRQVTQHALAAEGAAEAPDQAFADWSNVRRAAVDRMRVLLAELQAAAEVDLPMLAVASRQLRAIAES
jgi:glutamate dehydrogenase